MSGVLLICFDNALYLQYATDVIGYEILVIGMEEVERADGSGGRLEIGI